MSQIRADNITNRQGTGAPIFVNGIRVVGLTSIANIVANTGTFSGAVSIGGTLTYEDVTNVDSVGVVTARNGIKVTGGDIDVTNGDIDILADNKKLKIGLIIFILVSYKSSVVLAGFLGIPFLIIMI